MAIPDRTGANLRLNDTIRTFSNHEQPLGGSIERGAGLIYNNELSGGSSSRVPVGKFNHSNNLIQFPSTRAKLESLNERIAGFEKQLETDARMRRETDQGRMGAIRETIEKLEKTLNGEVKRRAEANKTLQSMFETHISSVEEKVETLFLEKLDQLQIAVESVMERVASVENDFEEERHKIQRTEEERAAWIAKEFASHYTQIENDKLLRREREEHINKRINELEQKTQNRLETLRTNREHKIESLRVAFEESKRIRERNDEKISTFLLEEIAHIKDSLVIESQTRESADDDIVQAVNHYTKALQDALRLINAI